MTLVEPVGREMTFEGLGRRASLQSLNDLNFCGTDAAHSLAPTERALWHVLFGIDRACIFMQDARKFMHRA